MASWSPRKSPGKREGPGGPYPWSKRRVESVEETVETQTLTTADIVAAQSQDYVDEKELEFRQTIQHLAEEQERVQKKVFTNWTNHYLAQHDPPMRVEDLVEDLRDGAKLIALIEHLSGERLHGERGRRLRRPHFLSNVNQVLQFLERKRIKLVNINATDVVDGKPAITLGLIWTIILHFQIEEKTKLLHEQMAYLQTCASSTSSLDSVGAYSPMPSRESPHRLVSTAPAAAVKPIVVDKWKGGARKTLLHWVRNSISQRFGVEVNDFGSSWRDGWAFLAIIHRIRPSLVNIDQFRNATNLVRLETAFRIAETELGIARLLDPEDVDVPHPDEKSIMTYVAQFLHLYPDTYATAELDQKDLSFAQTSDLQTISLWLDKAESVLDNRKLVPDYKTQYYQFYTLKTEMKNLRDTYERLRTKVNSAAFDVDLRTAWPSILQRWTKVEKELQEWQNSLDSNLPGALGKLAKWLMEAEKRLALPLLPTAQSNEMHQIAKKALNDHLEFFKPLDGYLKLLKSWHQLPESSQVSADHVVDLQSRLEHVAVLSHQRQVKLQLENARYALLDLLSDVEEHLKNWNKKFGFESDVKKVLTEYQTFVEGKKIFEEFDKNYMLTKTNVETCQHVGALAAKEMDKMEKFLSDVDGLWKKMMVDLHSVANTAKQVLSHWQEYSMNLPLLLSWFDKAEVVLTQDADTQLEFFQDLAHWQEVKNTVVDSGEYLGATCREDISRDIKQTVNSVRLRWDRLFPHIKDYLLSGEILRSRHVFQKNIKHLQAWLSDAESILSTPVACKPKELENYTTKLKELQVEWEEYDNLFKKLSKQMHSVVTHMTAPEVERIMSSMKKDKEALLRLKTNMMTRLQVLYQLVPSLEAIEKNLSDVSNWLDEAGEIIASYGIPSSPEAIKVLQDKHKVFFSQSSGFKSRMENTKSIYKSILEYSKGMPNLDVSDLQIKISNTDARLQSILALANDWNNAMTEASNRWQVYQEKLHIVKEKLQAAEAFLNKKPSDKIQLQAQKAFFSNLNDSSIRDLIASSDAVLATLPAPEHGPVKEIVQTLHNKWKSMMQKIPSHLLLQEFRIKEQEFSTQVHEMRRQLHSQQQMIDGGESAELVLQKHMAFFTPLCISNVKDCLGRMKVLCDEYKTCPQSTADVPESYIKDEKEWIQLQIDIEAFLSQLRQLKADWTEYCQRFNDLLKWMDDVECSIKAITDDITSADEFETIKTKFLAVCQTVDSRREDVKWLVRKLENLLAHIPEDEGAAEQKKLDDLLARYKSLLPEIDTTILITETITKCFVYREEVVEVKRWLKEVRAVTDSVEETTYDDPHKLSELVQQQEAIVQQLETHLGNVKYSVQKGKDLQVQKMSPKFVAKEVTELESNWENVYKAATEKLNFLKNAHQRWDDYDKQKDEIFRLLKQADDELKKLKQTMNVQQSAKQYKELEKSTDTNLKKFKTVGQNLAPQLSDKKRPLLEKEVVEIEKKVLMVMSTLKENLEYLERSTEKWTNFNFKLEGFVSQIDSIIDRLKNILSESLPPEERLRKLDELHAEILEQKQVLVNLETESQELARDQPDSANVKQIIGQLTSLNDKLRTLEETVITQRNIICKNLEALKNVKDILKTEREELRAAELRVEAGPPTPVSLNETRSKKGEVEVSTI